MAKRKSNTVTPEWAAGLQVERFGKQTTYIGTREEILSTGILPTDLLPEQFQDFSITHNEHSIRGGKYGYGKWVRWELVVDDQRDHLANIDQYRSRFDAGIEMAIGSLQMYSQVDSADGFTYRINVQDAEEIQTHLARAHQALMAARLTRTRTDAPVLMLIHGGKPVTA